MESGQWWFKALWRDALGTAALYGALVVHVALALTALYRRRHLRMPAWEATQTARGSRHSGAALQPHHRHAAGSGDVFGQRFILARGAHPLGDEPHSGCAPAARPPPSPGRTGAWGCTSGCACAGGTRASASCSLPPPCSCPCSPRSASSPPAARRRHRRPIPLGARRCCGRGGRRSRLTRRRRSRACTSGPSPATAPRSRWCSPPAPCAASHAAEMSTGSRTREAGPSSCAPGSRCSKPAASPASRTLPCAAGAAAAPRAAWR